MTILSCMERWLPEPVMRKIKLLRMVWKYPYHFSTYAAALFDEPVSPEEVDALKAGLPPESCAAIDRYLKLRKLTEEDVFGYFPMVDLRTLHGGPEGALELQRRRLKTCLKKFPVLREHPTELLLETVLAHGLALASPEVLAYIRGRDFVDAGACRGQMTHFPAFPRTPEKKAGGSPGVPWGPLCAHPYCSALRISTGTDLKKRAGCAIIRGTDINSSTERKAEK